MASQNSTRIFLNSHYEMILKSTLLNVTLIFSLHCFADCSFFDNYACVANTKSEAQFASEVDALHFFVKLCCLASAETHSGSWFRTFILSEKV